MRSLCSRILLQINLCLMICIYTESQLAEGSGGADDGSLAINFNNCGTSRHPALEVARTRSLCFGTLLTSKF